ncbi:HD domain-containing protein [Geobacter sulfurreducens]|jgi:putative nucleotidyltransferase with HDIG domain|uniref:Metal-dependent phosphohydrolase, putative n=1 Tax=Geobacter sulfurreducens (strain ATCC 51573 / DSM 12127 / PCA) TaxID=243231 RepID=Q74DV9_GEOSL|nr:HD domain-containing protein [Geobacter sulfurreducens]AAR34582.1 metal-dependent phosphohydrolase, putative [Geobacter sulfurreducens PCA]ADI84041.1 metal-dependent phosphohydrolase, putative [Geobacter sulfurreducens KN400]AJY70918.1 HD family phosphohydrolase [Geobacter sulfurreducens]QVW36424.1 HD domain-containing protein [Geobacter sulfurreducens]UAC05237.1 HD domain-containing protein [Geobacter sulfurreducens]
MSNGTAQGGETVPETARHCRELVDRWLADGSFDRRLPEVARLRGVPQPEVYHAEGDAFVHTMLALSAVDGGADSRVFWGVLLHDIGKAETTEFISGRWRAWGHAERGAAMVPAVMERLGLPELAADVVWLVRHHTFHFSWNLTPDVRLTRNQRRFLEHPLLPLLLEVCRADADGSHGGSDKGDKIEQIADLLNDERRA